MHPDLVGRLAREGRLTIASTTEQAAVGLDMLSLTESVAFERFSEAYRDRFGFPFVICARENRKEAIMAAFPVRLASTADDERATALVEIGRIGRLRLLDAVSDPWPKDRGTRSPIASGNGDTPAVCSRPP